LKFEIFVTLKKEVLDPQGKAVEGAIQNLGLSSISNIRQGKYFTLEVNETDEKKAKQQAEEACKKLLANLTIEEYSIEKLS
jgi:phosphoribosylformylglycinamidine synthase